jgi:tryptophan synthase alpha chain
VCYVPLGDPIAAGREILDAYADAGVDVLEVGVPTERAWLDGPEVAGSMARALGAGTTPGSIGTTLGTWRQRRIESGASVPAILWFGYPSLPLEAIRDAAASHAIDALLMIEPYRHAHAATFDEELAQLGIARSAFLPWEPTPEDRVWAATATGYLMVQARPGVTGADGPSGDPAPLVREGRELAPGRPVVAGFGIGDPRDVVRVLGSGVDGVVVGSACIRALRDGGAEGLRTFLRSIVTATRSLP